MPRSKGKDAGNVRDALLKLARKSLEDSTAMEETAEGPGSEPENDLEAALRVQEEKVNSKATKNAQLRVKRVALVAAWAQSIIDSCTSTREAARSRHFSKSSKEKERRPKEEELKAYLRENNLITTGDLDMLALRVLNPTDDDQVVTPPTALPKVDTRVTLLSWLKEKHVHMPSSSKSSNVVEVAKVVASYVHATTGGSGSEWDCVPEHTRAAVLDDPPPDDYRAQNLYGKLKEKYPPKPQKSAKTKKGAPKKKAKSKSAALPTSAECSAVASGTAATTKPVAGRRRAGANAAARKATIKQSELKNAENTVKRKVATFQELADGTAEIVVIVRRKHEDKTSSIDIVGGSRDGDAEDLIFMAGKVIHHNKKGGVVGRAYMEKKNVRSFDMVSSPGALVKLSCRRGRRGRARGRPWEASTRIASRALSPRDVKKRKQ